MKENRSILLGDVDPSLSDCRPQPLWTASPTCVRDLILQTPPAEHSLAAPPSGLPAVDWRDPPPFSRLPAVLPTGPSYQKVHRLSTGGNPPFSRWPAAAPPCLSCAVGESAFSEKNRDNQNMGPFNRQHLTVRSRMLRIFPLGPPGHRTVLEIHRLSTGRIPRHSAGGPSFHL